MPPPPPPPQRSPAEKVAAAKAIAAEKSVYESSASPALGGAVVTFGAVQVVRSMGSRSGHAAYSITTQARGQPDVTVSKRFSEFDALWAELRRWLHWSELPVLPQKSVFSFGGSQLEKKFLHARRAALQQCMEQLIAARTGRTLLAHGPGALIEVFLGITKQTHAQVSA